LVSDLVENFMWHALPKFHVLFSCASVPSLLISILLFNYWLNDFNCFSLKSQKVSGWLVGHAQGREKVENGSKGKFYRRKGVGCCNP